jgi:hypothetical protein
MRAFDVHLNGKRLCIAGIGEEGVLTTTINQVVGRERDDLFAMIGGLISTADEHVKWRHLKLRVGNEIAVKIIETDRVDKPRKRYHTNSKEDERNSKAYACALAKKYGWKLLTSRRRSK